MDKRTDRWTGSPCVVHDSVPFKAASKWLSSIFQKAPYAVHIVLRKIIQAYSYLNNDISIYHQTTNTVHSASPRARLLSAIDFFHM